MRNKTKLILIPALFGTLFSLFACLFAGIDALQTLINLKNEQLIILQKEDFFAIMIILLFAGLSAILNMIFMLVMMSKK